jgi:hypothetical protein
MAERRERRHQHLTRERLIVHAPTLGLGPAPWQSPPLIRLARPSNVRRVAGGPGAGELESHGCR